MIRFQEGQTVRVRGTRSLITQVSPSSVDSDVARLDVRVITGERPGSTFSVITPIDEVVPEEPPALSLERLTPYRTWEQFHDAFRFELAPPPGSLVARPCARIAIEEYQRVPAARILRLPRPRLLIADDVGLGKTVEAGLVYLELAARRRARRVLVVVPASITAQWRAELLHKFGVEFDVFTRDHIDAVRRSSDVGANPFTLRNRVIISLDLAKMENTFAELRGSAWDLAIMDEAHHVALAEDADATLNRRFAEWLSRAAHGLVLLSATPHDGSDATFASLLGLLEPRIVPPGAGLQRAVVDPYIVRRLKRDIRSADGTPRFVERLPVNAVAVTLSAKERALHDDVIGAIALLREAAQSKSGEERVRIEFLATIIRKRLASSRAALTVTIRNRKEKVETHLGALQSRRDLLRRARAGDVLDEQEQAQLELDLHASVAAEQQRAARASKRAESERDLFEELERSLTALQGEPETKVQALATLLDTIRTEEPNENVIIFSEYRDTVESLGAALRERFGDAVMALHGDSEDRDPVLTRFSREGGLILIATDFASEGLNLQARSHTLVHYDLPWNPNRLEQRNGRIDRYGQTKAPAIHFLYASDTYDGELLKILVRKVENQIAAIGAVGDVLGAFQPRKIDELFARHERVMSVDLRRDAERRIGAVLDAAVAPPALRELSTSGKVPSLIELPPIGPFVVGAVRQCGGEASIEDGELRITKRPPAWREPEILPRYALANSGSDATLLTEASPVFRSAVAAVRELRYDQAHDPRVAAVTRKGLPAPLVLATFVISLRARDGEMIDEIVSYASGASGEVREALALIGAADGVEPTSLQALAAPTFGSWWRRAAEACTAEARDESERRRTALASERASAATRAKRQLGDWFAAECRRVRDDAGLGTLLSLEADPPRVTRAIRALELEHDRAAGALDAYADVAVAQVEPIGLLLLVPAP